VIEAGIQTEVSFLFMNENLLKKGPCCWRLLIFKTASFYKVQ
jgi:hypothetical protein